MRTAKQIGYVNAHAPALDFPVATCGLAQAGHRQPDLRKLITQQGGCHMYNVFRAAGPQESEGVFKTWLVALGEKKKKKILWLFFQLSLFISVLKKILVQRPDSERCKSL